MKGRGWASGTDVYDREPGRGLGVLQTSRPQGRQSLTLVVGQLRIWGYGSASGGGEGGVKGFRNGSKV